MANKNQKWSQDLRKALYSRLASEFGPYAGWGKVFYPEGRKERLLEVLKELADYFTSHTGSKFEWTALDQQMKWGITRQGSVKNAGFAYQYILNKAAALETGFITSSDLRGFMHLDVEDSREIAEPSESGDLEGGDDEGEQTGPLTLETCEAYDIIEDLGNELDLVAGATETAWRCWLHPTAYQMLKEPAQFDPEGYIYTENGNEYVKVHDNVAIPFVIHLRIAGLDDTVPTAYPEGLGTRSEVDDGFPLPSAQKSANDEYRAKREGPPPELNGEYDFEVIKEYSRFFDGVRRMGGIGGIGLIAASLTKQFEQTGEWSGSIDELRAALLAMVSEQEDAWLQELEAVDSGELDDFSEPKKLERLRSLYNTIRERWDEVITSRNDASPSPANTPEDPTESSSGETLFTTGWFGDGFSIVRQTDNERSGTFQIESHSVTAGLDFLSGLSEEDMERWRDDEDGEIDWSEHQKASGASQQPEEPKVFESFEESLAAACSPTELLTSNPHFIHPDYSSAVRDLLEKAWENLTDEDRTAFGESLPQSVAAWFSRLPNPT